MNLWKMAADSGQAILNLCVSDQNKELLLNAEGFIPMMVDSLLLDPEHPRMDNVTIMGKTDWEGSKGPVQRVSSCLRACRSVSGLKRTYLCAGLCRGHRPARHVPSRP